MANRQYKIKVVSILNYSEPYKAIFPSKRAFMANSLWAIISERNLEGTIIVQYGSPKWYNEFHFKGVKDLETKLDACLEEDLVERFQ